MENTAVKVDNISKLYKLGERGYASLKEDLANFFNIKLQKKHTAELWALKDISFELKKGEALGVIGPNGAGKSTLLKLLSGVTLPSSGEIKINGRKSSLIELTAGFHPELTGRENIYLFGSIKGMKKKEIDSKFDAIVDFSGIKHFIDTPIKRYSSGMHARLGFSVSAHINPDVLIIDEVLSVGDLAFQRKCLDYMEKIRNQNKSIIFVSHNLSSIKNLCDKVLWLNKGQAEMTGKPDDVITAYTNYMQNNSQFIQDCNFIGQKTRWGTGEINFNKVQLLNSDKKETQVFSIGEKMIVSMNFMASKKIANPTFWVGIINNDEIKISGTYYNKERAGNYSIEGEGNIECVFDGLFLKPGIYHIMAGIYDEYASIAYDRIGRVCSFEMINKHLPGFEKFKSYGAEGLIDMNNIWSYSNNE